MTHYIIGRAQNKPMNAVKLTSGPFSNLNHISDMFKSAIHVRAPEAASKTSSDGRQESVSMYV